MGAFLVMSGAAGSSLSSGSAGDSSTTPRRLLQEARAADPRAWDRLIDLYAPLVLRWCRRWGLPEQEAADVLQEVFQAVAVHLADFRKEKPGDTFRGWLRMIARNKVRDHFRRRAREPGGVGGTEALVRLASLPAVLRPSDAGESADDGAEADDAGEVEAECGLFGRALERIRAEFEERTWRAFWLTAVEDRVPKDVGTELGMSPGAVRVAKSRVLRRLREELGEPLA